VLVVMAFVVPELLPGSAPITQTVLVGNARTRTYAI
jgi:hypothetical protein